MKKKFFGIDKILALVLFLGLFAVETYVIYIVNDAQSASFAVSIAFSITIVIAAIFSVAMAVRYAGIHRKKVFDYLKRMWGYIIMLVVVGYAITFIPVVLIEPFLLPQLEKLHSLAFIAIKVVFLIAYLVFVYRIIHKYGYIHASKTMFNLDCQIVTFITAFMFIIPPAIKDSMYPVINPHSALTPNVSRALEGEKFNVILVAILILVTIAIEICVLTVAYMKGKQTYIKGRIRDAVYETDE